MHLVKTEPFNFKSHFGSLIPTLAKMFISLYLSLLNLKIRVLIVPQCVVSA